MRRLLLLGLAAGLVAGEAADAASAMRLPAGGTALAVAARAWDADTLLRLLDDADPARRRGAARLAAALPVPAERLLPALIANQDREVRRLGAHGLRGMAVPLAELAKLPDPDLIAALLAVHPAADPIADAAIAPLIITWLESPATAQRAARLIASRGDVARWGEPLITALGHRDDAVVTAAHGALQALTRTQRGLDAYAGDRRLLAQDWRDTLAAQPITPPADPELMALVAELPAAEALVAVLGHGPAALAAIERAQADATRTRRRELEPAARLLAHAVPPGLWQALGAEAFTDLDSADPARRLACLRALAAEIKTRADPDGLGMLIAALDDPETQVRATALDQLVRLSDEAKRFKRPWKLEDNALFAPDRAMHRLRRSLRDGSGDEQIAALLLIGSLEAKQLIDDVLTLILSPRGDVVDTALETITRLDPSDRQIPALSRLLDDAQAPIARRITAAKTLGEILKRSRWSSNRTTSTSPAMAPLLRLTRDPETRLATAAATALAGGSITGPMLRTVLDGLIARGQIDAAIGIAEDRSEPEIIALVADRLIAGGTDADRAALALAEGLRTRSSDQRTATERVCAKPELRATLTAPTSAGRATLAHVLGLVPLSETLTRVATDAEQRSRCLRLLAEGAPDIAALELVAQTIRSTDGSDHGPDYELRTRALALAALAPERLPAVIRNAQDLLRTTNSNSSSDDGKQIRTLTLRDGSTLRIEAPQPTGRDSWDSDDLDWSLSKPAPATAPDADGLARLARIVAAQPVADDDARRSRDLALAWLRGSEPAPALAAGWQRDDDLCRILAATWPAFRQAVVARIIADVTPGETSLWQLRGWLKLDPEHLLPVAVRALRADEDPSEYEARPIIRLLADQPPAVIAALLPDLLAIPAVAAQARTLLPKAGPLPLDIALSLAESGALGDCVVAEIPASSAEQITQRLGLWNAPAVLARAKAVRQLREHGTVAVDAALTTLIQRGDVPAAAWLRSGIPAEAGMIAAYRAAETSPVPELALVGSAFALREKRLAMADFLQRIGTWPSQVQADAAAAAKRYGEGTWPTLAEPAAQLVAKLGARSLSAWVAILPPSEPVIAALAERISDPATADAVGGALSGRLAREPQAWQAAVRTLAARANGRLDWLLPMTGKP